MSCHAEELLIVVTEALLSVPVLPDAAKESSFNGAGAAGAAGCEGAELATTDSTAKADISASSDSI